MKKIFVISLFYMIAVMNIELIAQPPKVKKRPCVKEGVLDGNNLSEKQRKYVTALEENDTLVLMVPADVILDRVVYILHYHNNKNKWGLEEPTHEIALAVLQTADIIKADWTINDDVSSIHINRTDMIGLHRRPPYKGEINLEWDGKVILSMDDWCPLLDSRAYNIPGNPGSRPPSRHPFVTGGPFIKGEAVDLFWIDVFEDTGDTIKLTDGKVATLMISKDSLIKRITQVLNHYAERDGWAKELPFSLSELSEEDILMILERSETAFYFFKKGQLEVDGVNERGEIVTYQRDSYLDVDINGNGKREAYLIFNPTQALGLKNLYKARVYLSLHDLSVVREVE